MPIPKSAAQQVAREYVQLKRTLEELGKREAELKRRLKGDDKEHEPGLIEQNGTLDPNDGHWYLSVEVDGKLVTLQKQRRAPVFFDPDAAALLLKKKGMLMAFSECQVSVVDSAVASKALIDAHLDEGHGFELHRAVTEDSVGDAFYKDVISEQEYHDLFEVKVSWALYVQEPK